jgi:DNA invertase Pin-like site-specific DNA recombinase
MLKGKRAHHVVALKLDRLFRNAEDALHQTSAWDSAGISLHLVDMGGQSLSTSSAIGRMMLTMMAAFAEFERNLISERTTFALAHKRSQRQAYNHTPYGFERPVGNILELPEEQQVVRSIKTWREKGETFQGIADRLNQDNVRTKHGAKWHRSTIRQILRNDLHR